MAVSGTPEIAGQSPPKEFSTLSGTDQKTGKPVSRAGMQSYRTEGGKLVETWIALQPLGSTWPDTPQEHWTSSPPIK